MPHFFLKLIPPRPTFAEDMTESERATMRRHVDYLATLLANGSGFAFGPVMHPEGAFGMGIIKAADAAAARKITDADPASALGHYEIYPMRLLKKDEANGCRKWRGDARNHLCRSRPL